MSTTTSETPVRQDGHSEGCSGTGVLGFTVKVRPNGQRFISEYRYCRVPIRQHYPTTEGTDPCL